MHCKQHTVNTYAQIHTITWRQNNNNDDDDINNDDDG